MIDIKNKKIRISALTINIIIIILEIIGLIISIKCIGMYAFVFYTILSNVLTMISSIIYTVHYFLKKDEAMPYWIQLVRYMGSNCLALTFLVVFTVLLPMMENGFYALVIADSQPFHHVICPIISVISYGLLEDGKPTIKDALIATSPTLLYAVVTIILNIAKVLEGPYPFLMVYEQPFYMSIVWFLVIDGVSFVLALLIRYLTKFKKVDDDNENNTENIEMV